MDGYILASILAPVPVIHFWLHALLPHWRKRPWLFYVWGVLIWLGSFALFWFMQERALFGTVAFPPVWQQIGIVLKLIAGAGIFYGIYRIGWLNFFIWGVLHPAKQYSVARRQIPFLSAIPHLAYLSYLLFAAGGFLLTGNVLVLVAFLFAFICLPLVMHLEDEELAKRFGNE